MVQKEHIQRPGFKKFSRGGGFPDSLLGGVPYPRTPQKEGAAISDVWGAVEVKIGPELI